MGNLSTDGVLRALNNEITVTVNGKTYVYNTVTRRVKGDEIPTREELKIIDFKVNGMPLPSETAEGTTKVIDEATANVVKPDAVVTNPVIEENKPEEAEPKADAVVTKPVSVTTEPKIVEVKPEEVETKPDTVSVNPFSVATKPSIDLTESQKLSFVEKLIEFLKALFFGVEQEVATTKQKEEETKPEIKETKPETAVNKPDTTDISNIEEKKISLAQKLIDFLDKFLNKDKIAANTSEVKADDSVKKPDTTTTAEVKDAATTEPKTDKEKRIAEIKKELEDHASVICDYNPIYAQKRHERVAALNRELYELTDGKEGLIV
ncbi:hypothetical protein IJS77_05400 [bacterium]|nr:hypothetical protein [bacterium]